MATVFPELHQIGAEDRPRRLVPQHHVIRRVPGRVHDFEIALAGRDALAVDERRPRQRLDVLARPRHLAERGRRPARRQGRRSRGVIRMRMGDQHPRGPSGHRGGDRLEMLGLADARIDQQRPVAGNQVGPVAGAGVRPRIGGMQD